jgi:glycosyltransferase involved in cell wall biosynthesis
MQNDVGTLVAIISQLNTQPVCAPVNASMAASRLATHDSGSGWFATPFLCDSFIHDSTPVYPGALCGLQLAERLAAHYASADVFLFPSETETFGNVTLEAMASGLAVVAYDYAAAGWHITHGETGILVPFGNARTFVDSTVRLLAGSEPLEKMRARARNYATSISWDRVVERFEALLLGAADQNRAARGSMPGGRSVAEPARGRV